GFDEGPRSVPVVANGRVYTFGAEGQLHAIDLATGRKIWSEDTAARFRVRKGFFGAAGSPLVEDGRVLANVGGSDGAGIGSVNAASPVVVGDLVFVSASYETGAAVLRVAGNTLTEVWASDESLSNHYATSVHHNGYLYGFHGRQEFGPSLRCIMLKTGKVQWSVDRFHAGTITL